jgi:16S rRNA (adenine1518-N6/adenine1519-N6)-dimethyltransferase
MNARPKKSFGQHFLHDRRYIERIVSAVAPRAEDFLVEIGPGEGALTLPLLAAAGKLTAIELDTDLIPGLQARAASIGELHIVHADVLKVDFSALAHSHGVPRLRIAGNLPYYISSPILFHCVEHAAAIQDMHFMLQKEVVDRMVAAPATADYGRLSVMLQWRYAMENVLSVPPEAFDPPPKVDSAVVRMVPYAQPPEVDEELLSELVQVAFSQRRKILRNTLGKWLEQHGFAGTFDVQRRAEEVPVAEYLALCAEVKRCRG